MPIYEYICTACDHRADILHGINDPAPQYCLSCGKGGTMRKLFAPPTIHYKGSGWAKKDRGGASARSSSGQGTSSTASGDAGGASSGGASSGDAASRSAASGSSTSSGSGSGD
ncbi:MAG: zinc ribbon domain-containing protein [Chloroflexota bacterium]